MGDEALSKFQFGVEGTPGSAVAADTMFYGLEMSPLLPDRKPARPRANIGVKTESAESYFYQYLVSDTMRFPYGYFQVLPVIFSCGIKGGVSPAEQTTDQNDYLWTFTPSETATNSHDSITFERGDNVQAYEAEYLMFERIRISGVVAQGMDESPVVVEGGFFARQWTPTDFTAALTAPTVNFMNAKLATIAVDTTWAGVGGTPLTNTLRAFDIELLTGVHPKFFGSAYQYFDSHGEDVIGFIANFTLEGNSSADGIYDTFRSQALQVVRLTITGPQIGTGDPHSMVLDLGGTWDDVQPMAEQVNGNNLHRAILVPEYDATGAKKLALTVTTNVDAI